MEMRHQNPRSIPLLDQLRAIETVLSEPHRLVDAIRSANDDERAIEAVSREFQLSPRAARVVMDQQFRHLTRAAQAALQGDIVRAKSEPGPQTGHDG